ncbi:MAG: DUF5606 domain-containing protein [Bacteroidales bacterium]|nr:DUF5606 domain-containing protein [Bacteroidales bacterium]
MDLKKIITIAGQPDLFELITNTHKGIIVESIITKKRQQAFASQRVNSLEDIAVYTTEGEIPLAEVFVKMYKHLEGKQAPDTKTQSNDIKPFFEEFFPEYDRERVKFSAMKKILKWYNVLNENGFVDDKIEKEEEQSTEESVEKTDSEKENKE